MQQTRLTLLAKLRDSGSDRAWEDFYRLYASVITAYGRKLGLDHNAAQDVLQETMVTLMRVLPRFTYDAERGKFRNFLLTIVHRKTLSAHRRSSRRAERSLDAPSGSDDDGPSLLDGMMDDRVMHPSEVMERNWQASLFDEAVQSVLGDPTLDPKTAAVFKAYFVETQPADAVAKAFGIAKNNVYQIRNRLLNKVKAEVKRLENDIHESVCRA